MCHYYEKVTLPWFASLKMQNLFILMIDFLSDALHYQSVSDAGNISKTGSREL